MATKSTTSTKKDAAQDILWNTVTNVTELETALANQDKNIFIKNGTYATTQTIVPYDGLHIKGEAYPSDDTNSKNDGVLFTSGSHQLISSIRVDPYVTIDVVPPVRGDRTIQAVTTLGTDLAAGDFIELDAFHFTVLNDALSTDTQVYIKDSVAGVGIIDTTMDVRTVNARSITFENFMFARTVGYGDIFELYNIDTLEINRVGVDGASTMVGFGTIDNCDNIIVTDISASDNGNYTLAISKSNNCHVKRAKRAGWANTYPTAIDFNRVQGFSVRDMHGSAFEAAVCWNGEVSNIHCAIHNTGRLLLINSGYFTVSNCSTLETTTGFNCYGSTHFTVTDCDAPSAATPIDLVSATDYQVYGNHWQDEVLHTQDVDYITTTGPVVGTTWTAHGISPTGMTPDSLLHLQGIEGMNTDVLRISEPITKGGNKIFGVRASGGFQFENYSNDNAITVNQWDNNEDMLLLIQRGIGRGFTYSQESSADCPNDVFQARTALGTGNFTGNFLNFYNNSVQVFQVDNWGDIDITNRNDNDHSTPYINILQSGLGDITGDIIKVNTFWSSGKLLGNYISLQEDNTTKFEVDRDGSVTGNGIASNQYIMTGVNSLSGTQTLDLDYGYHLIEVDGDITLSDPITNTNDYGKSGMIVLRQDPTGGHTITFNSKWTFPAGSPTEDTTAYYNNFFRYTVVDGNSVTIEFLGANIDPSGA